VPEARASREVIVRTEDWQAALRFYGSLLGFPVSYRAEKMVGFETGAFCLYVEQGAAHGPVFEYLVPDLAAMKAKLLAAGCILLQEDPDIPRCYLQDPFGVVFNLGQAPGR